MTGVRCPDRWEPTGVLQDITTTNNTSNKNRNIELEQRPSPLSERVVYLLRLKFTILMSGITSSDPSDMENMLIAEQRERILAGACNNAI